MPRLISCRHLAFVCLGTLLAVPVQAGRKPEIRIAESAHRPFEVSAPAQGAVLVAGSLAEVAWEPRAGFEAIEKAEEWEAFLSVNGGKTYPLRVTPHLDIDVRRFHWTVPNLQTWDARILLRFGNERLETGFELPLRFAIAVNPQSFDLSPASLSLERGESARPWDEGVIFWVEGTRQGGALRQVVVAAPRGIRPVLAAQEWLRVWANLAPQNEVRPGTLAAGWLSPGFDRSAARWSDSPARRGPPPDLLLLHRRRNE